MMYRCCCKKEAYFLFDLSGAYISDVSPDAGSLGGETRITIHGGGT